MSKKAKLNLGELKVKSFLTTLEREETKKLRGGRDTEQDCTVDSCTCAQSYCECLTEVPTCINTCVTCETCPPMTWKTEC